MRYHNITKEDMLNGDGLRVVLWVAGCTHQCKGCHNPQTWDIDGGIEWDKSARQELFEALDKDYISGITFSGGDPLHPENLREVEQIARECKKRFQEKTIWLYTGYRFEEIMHLPVMKLVDVLVDGPFVEAQKDIKLHWRGSANQRVIDVPASFAKQEVVLHDIEEEKEDAD